MSGNSFGIGEGDEFEVDGERFVVQEANREEVTYMDKHFGGEFSESMEEFRERLATADHWKIYRYNTDGELSQSYYGHGSEVVEV